MEIKPSVAQSNIPCNESHHPRVSDPLITSLPHVHPSHMLVVLYLRLNSPHSANREPRYVAAKEYPRHLPSPASRRYYLSSLYLYPRPIHVSTVMVTPRLTEKTSHTPFRSSAREGVTRPMCALPSHPKRRSSGDSQVVVRKRDKTSKLHLSRRCLSLYIQRKSPNSP